jgi:hypothetical protein
MNHVVQDLTMRQLLSCKNNNDYESGSLNAVAAPKLFSAPLVAGPVHVEPDTADGPVPAPGRHGPRPDCY